MQKAMGFLAMIVVGLWLSGAALFFLYCQGQWYTDPVAPARSNRGYFCVMENKEAKNPLLEAEVKRRSLNCCLTHGYPSPASRRPIICCFSVTAWRTRSVSAAAPDYYGSIGWVGVWLGGRAAGRPLGLRRDALGATSRQRYPLRPLLLINVVEARYRTQKILRPVWVGEAAARHLR